jgi:hypothetical protein
MVSVGQFFWEQTFVVSYVFSGNFLLGLSLSFFLPSSLLTILGFFFTSDSCGEKERIKNHQERILTTKFFENF